MPTGRWRKKTSPESRFFTPNVASAHKLRAQAAINLVVFGRQSSYTSTMLRLTRAPNIAIAALWADALQQAGYSASVQRYFLGSVAGELPPDQCQPACAAEHAAAALAVPMR